MAGMLPFPLHPMAFTLDQKWLDNPEDSTAVTYLIIDNSTDGTILEKVAYVGQTTRPYERFIEHKCKGFKGCDIEMRIVMEHSGKQAVVQSLTWEFLVFAHKECFPNLKEDCFPGNGSEMAKTLAAFREAEKADERLKQDVVVELTKTLMGEKPTVRELSNFQCKKCTASFNSKSAWVRHQEVHKETKHNFKCNLCDARYEHKRNLVKHMRNKHSDAGEKRIPASGKQERKKCQCPICQTQLSAPDALKKHLQRAHRLYGKENDEARRKAGVKIRRPRFKKNIFNDLDLTEDEMEDPELVAKMRAFIADEDAAAMETDEDEPMTAEEEAAEVLMDEETEDSMESVNCSRGDLPSCSQWSR